jgi:hypothetical protein
MQPEFSDLPIKAADWRRTARENGAGIAGSLLLHGAAALLIFMLIVEHAAETPQRPLRIIPIDLVTLGERTMMPEAAVKSPTPQQRASSPVRPASPVRAAVSPTGTKPAPEDALDEKLRALAQLRAPDVKLKLGAESGVSNVDAGEGAAGDRAAYSIRDYVRAIVERHWSLNLSHLSERAFVIPLRIVMKRDGTIVSADIADAARAKADAVYRDIAISARNAALLSSPIALPPGDYAPRMTFTLDLDPRDTLR